MEILQLLFEENERDIYIQAVQTKLFMISTFFTYNHKEQRTGLMQARPPKLQHRWVRIYCSNTQRQVRYNDVL